MYFDERRALNQPQQQDSKACHQTSPATHNSHQGSHNKSQGSLSANHGQSPPPDLKTAKMLDCVNNKLQELMQILYLLSRDAAVPTDARYHVTVAQGEIALLARVLRNTAELETGENPAQSQTPSFRTAHP